MENINCFAFFVRRQPIQPLTKLKVKFFMVLSDSEPSDYWSSTTLCSTQRFKKINKWFCLNFDCWSFVPSFMDEIWVGCVQNVLRVSLYERLKMEQNIKKNHGIRDKFCFFSAIIEKYQINWHLSGKTNEKKRRKCHNFIPPRKSVMAFNTPYIRHSIYRFICVFSM